MAVHEDLERVTRDYGPLLADLKPVLEAELGPLTWADPGGTRQIHLIEGYDVIRCGPISGFGVLLPTVNPDALEAAIVPVLVRHGFEIKGNLLGSTSGHLILHAKDADGVAFTLTCKSSVDAWIDERVRR